MKNLKKVTGLLDAISFFVAGSFTTKMLNGQVIELGTNRQLLFDDLFLEKSRGIELRMISSAKRKD